MAGQRLDRFIHWKIPRLSRSRAEEITRRGACRPDGTRLPPETRVDAREVILLVRERFDEPDAPDYFSIAYEDESLVAVDKPAGLVVHPSATYHKKTLTNLLLQHFGKPPPQMAHRLDRETSGLVLCGRQDDVSVALKKMFEARSIQKEYVAIVCGVMAHDRGEIDVPLRRCVPKDEMAPAGELHVLMETTNAEAPDAQLAQTGYEVLERSASHTLIKLFPHTGRQHQLRVHLAHIGFPIVGDKLYGVHGTAPFLRMIEEGISNELLLQLGHERHCLHAFALNFEHPRTQTAMRIECAMPEDMSVLWKTFSAATNL